MLLKISSLYPQQFNIKIIINVKFNTLWKSREKLIDRVTKM